MRTDALFRPFSSGQETLTSMELDVPIVYGAPDSSTQSLGREDLPDRAFYAFLSPTTAIGSRMR